MSNLTFDEYSKIFEQTAIYPNKGMNLYYPTLGLCGETGEIAEKIKKIHRDRGGIVTWDDKELLVKELGDVLWYLNALAAEIGVSLEYVAEVNTEKLLDRLERGKLQGSGDTR
jgi:NTP pyrophosphatase (non-canonical NTP hydrolase)